jgi:hypothetical protein
MGSERILHSREVSSCFSVFCLFLSQEPGQSHNIRVDLLILNGSRGPIIVCIHYETIGDFGDSRVCTGFNGLGASSKRGRMMGYCTEGYL